MRLILISLILFFLISNYGHSQTDLCQNIYVWDFKTGKNERNFISNTISNEIEDALTQINNCKILQRRKYADIQKQVDNEIQISNVEDLSDELRKKLKTIQAERVLFGEIEQDFSFNVNLRLRLEHLYTKQIKTATVLIEAEKMINSSLRNQVIQDAIIKLLNLNSSDISSPTNFSMNEVQASSKVIRKNDIQVTLVKCERDENNVTAYVEIMNLVENRKMCSTARNFTCLDENGDRHFLQNTSRVDGQKFSAIAGLLCVNVAYKDAHFNASLIFSKFNESIKKIKLLNLHFDDKNFEFRDIEIE